MNTQAMKLLDLHSRLVDAGQQLTLSLVEGMASEVHGLRLQLLANLVQLLVPLVPVPNITGSIIAQFKKVAGGAGLRYCWIWCLSGQSCCLTACVPAKSALVHLHLALGCSGTCQIVGVSLPTSFARRDIHVAKASDGESSDHS